MYVPVEVRLGIRRSMAASRAFGATRVIKRETGNGNSWLRAGSLLVLGWNCLHGKEMPPLNEPTQRHRFPPPALEPGWGGGVVAIHFPFSSPLPFFELELSTNN